MRRITIVVEGGDLGAAMARAIAIKLGLGFVGYSVRRDAGTQCIAMATASDSRTLWVKGCRDLGLKVRKAPWE